MEEVVAVEEKVEVEAEEEAEVEVGVQGVEEAEEVGVKRGLRRLVRITGGPSAHGREETASAASAHSSSRCGHAPLRNSRLNDTSPPLEIESCCTSTSVESSTLPSCSSASVSHCARKRGDNKLLVEARRLDATQRACRAVRSAAERLSKLLAAIARLSILRFANLHKVTSDLHDNYNWRAARMMLRSYRSYKGK